MTTEHFWTFILILLCAVRFGASQTHTDVKNLLTQLFKTQSYDKKIRPMADQTTAKFIWIDFMLFGITDFDEIEQKLTTTAYLQIAWYDEMLVWTPASYGNLTIIQVPQTDVWLPDIALHNGFQDLKGLGSTFIQIDVSNNGLMWWYPFHVFESKCTLDSTYFPFDKQICDIDFTSWSSHLRDLFLVVGNEGIIVKGKDSNGQWQMTSSQASSFAEASESTVRFQLVLKRKPLYYIVNIILPIILLSVLSIHTFQIPPDIGERLGYSVTVWLSFAVFLTIISTSLPQSSDTMPVLSIYILIQLTMGTISVLMSTWESRIVQYGDNKPVYFILRKLASLRKRLSTKRCCRGKNSEVMIQTPDIEKNEEGKEAKDKENGSETGVDWKEGVRALDFFTFWIFLGFFIASTIAFFIQSVIGGANSVQDF